MSYGVLPLFKLTEPNLSEMKSQAYVPIWYDAPCLLRLQPGRDFVVSGSRGFSVRKLLRTIFNYLILCQGLGLRFWVVLTVTITQNISTMLRAKLSEINGV